VWTLRRLSLASPSADRGGRGGRGRPRWSRTWARYESEVIDAARLLVSIPPDPGADPAFARLLADAVLHAPGFTPARWYERDPAWCGGGGLGLR